MHRKDLKIGRKIGMGSVGAVYKGTHIASGKVVAVKVPPFPTPGARLPPLREADSPALRAQTKAGRSFLGVTQRRLVPGSGNNNRTSAGYRWPGTQRIRPPSNGNRESAPFPVTMTGPPLSTVLRSTLAQMHAWKMFDSPLQGGEFAFATPEMVKHQALISATSEGWQIEQRIS